MAPRCLLRISLLLPMRVLSSTDLRPMRALSLIRRISLGSRPPTAAWPVITD